MKMVRFSASRTGRLYPQDMFLLLISGGAESTPGSCYVRKEYVTEKQIRSIWSCFTTQFLSSAHGTFNVDISTS